MDLEGPQWDEWEQRFIEVAATAHVVQETPDIRSARHYLCLNGDNGLAPQEEFEELELMAKNTSELKKVEVDSGFWQETVLFIP